MDVPRGMEYIEKAAKQELAEAQYFATGLRNNNNNNNNKKKWLNVLRSESFNSCFEVSEKLQHKYKVNRTIICHFFPAVHL